MRLLLIALSALLLAGCTVAVDPYPDPYAYAPPPRATYVYPAYPYDDYYGHHCPPGLAKQGRC